MMENEIVLILAGIMILENFVIWYHQIKIGDLEHRIERLESELGK